MTQPVSNESLRERNKREKLERLCGAARELFSTQGFHETTIRQIAARAGIGVGTVFLYVKDKEGLLELLFSEAILAVQEEAFASLPQSRSLLDEMVYIFSAFYRYYAKDRALSRLFIKELLFMPAERSQRRMELTIRFVGRLAERVQAAQDCGKLRSDSEAFLVATNFFATYFLLLVGFLDASRSETMDLEQATANLRTALELQIEGLRPLVFKSREAQDKAAARSQREHSPRRRRRHGPRGDK